MAVLDADSALPWRPLRVLVAGSSGAGKSTLAERIGTTLDLPYTEIDSLHHGPGWTRRPTFLEEVRELAAGSVWVTEWQYGDARPLLLHRADTVVWLDYSRWVVFSRLVRRTVVRRIRREPLWNGNVEPPLWTFLTDRDHVIRYSWRNYRARTAQRDRLVATADAARLAVVVLTTPRETRSWLAGSLLAAR